MPWPTEGPANDRLLALLARGKMTLRGLMPWSSNYTFLGQVSAGNAAVQVIYKPARGERPLWDFPHGTLGKREVAAYLVSRELAWHFVPPAVLRSGPHGRGSVQLFVQVDQDAHYFTFREEPTFRHSLQALCLFDVITNNADRKSGHCLRLGDGSVLAIDQALCFHVDDKLRTVIWEFAGEPLPADLAADLERLANTLRQPHSPLIAALSDLLYNGEIAALRRRTEALLAEGRFPDPPEDRRAYPWPLI
ncbi:MAG: SCO1664 family protein [Anaerolineae bacterium]